MKSGQNNPFAQTLKSISIIILKKYSLRGRSSHLESRFRGQAPQLDLGNNFERFLTKRWILELFRNILVHHLLLSNSNIQGLCEFEKNLAQQNLRQFWVQTTTAIFKSQFEFRGPQIIQFISKFVFYDELSSFYTVGVLCEKVKRYL